MRWRWLAHSVRPDGSVHDDEPEPVLLVDAGPLDVEGAELLVSQLEEAIRALRA